MCISVACHLTAILLSMSFVNALNVAGRDSDIIRMFGEGQGYNATVKTADAFRLGICSLTVGVITMIGINFDWLDAAFCAAVSGGIFYQVVPTSKHLYESSSITEYWRWGRGEENGDVYDLRIPLARIKQKAKIGARMEAVLTGS